MKKLFFSAVVMILFAGLANDVMAQMTATASASATMLGPLTITNTLPMNFGNIASGTGGTIAMDVDGGLTPSGPTLLTGNTPSSAQFRVSAADGTLFAITGMPTSITLTGPALSIPMTIDGFVTTPADLTDETNASNEFIVKVGGILHVGLDQMLGLYTNATAFELTVAYN